MKNRTYSALRRARIKTGLLQIELAERTGIKQSSISLMERKGIKRVDKALAIARVLNCTVDELLDDQKPRA